LVILEAPSDIVIVSLPPLGVIIELVVPGIGYFCRCIVKIRLRDSLFDPVNFSAECCLAYYET